MKSHEMIPMHSSSYKEKRSFHHKVVQERKCPPHKKEVMASYEYISPVKED